MHLHFPISLRRARGRSPYIESGLHGKEPRVDKLCPEIVDPKGSIGSGILGRPTSMDLHLNEHLEPLECSDVAVLPVQLSPSVIPDGKLPEVSSRPSAPLCANRCYHRKKDQGFILSRSPDMLKWPLPAS